jgi:predicted DNA-binding transcriptional regulator AlpA
MTDSLLTTFEAAKYLCVSVAFLERDRWAGTQVPYIKVGSRAVRYRKSDLEEYIAGRKSSAPASAVSAAGAPTARRGATR